MKAHRDIPARSIWGQHRPMKNSVRFAVALLWLCAADCGGSATAPPGLLVGDWMNNVTSTSTGGAGITLDANGTFSTHRLMFTGATSANEEEQTGVYQATDSTLTLTTREYSCPPPATAPVFSSPYIVDQSVLTLVTPSESILFNRVITPLPWTTRVLGCFRGDFVPSPLTPVAN
jgi:hypothetical protein